MKGEYDVTSSLNNRPAEIPPLFVGSDEKTTLRRAPRRLSSQTMALVSKKWSRGVGTGIGLSNHKNAYRYRATRSLVRGRLSRHTPSRLIRQRNGLPPLTTSPLPAAPTDMA